MPGGCRHGLSQIDRARDHHAVDRRADRDAAREVDLVTSSCARACLQIGLTRSTATSSASTLGLQRCSPGLTSSLGAPQHALGVPSPRLRPSPPRPGSAPRAHAAPTARSRSSTSPAVTRASCSRRGCLIDGAAHLASHLDLHHGPDGAGGRDHGLGWCRARWRRCRYLGPPSRVRAPHNHGGDGDRRRDPDDDPAAAVHESSGASSRTARSVAGPPATGNERHPL